ncbi:MAG: hypothetical protein HY688_03995 [Chloroflexi bacterium]|nr:hypothetical protein [Chloroflexota bacterium]
MSTTDYALLAGLVFLYTFIFDAIDLQPQIGSFRFLQSLNFAFYYLFQSVLGVLASLVLVGSSLDLAVPFLALLGVLGGVTVLQNIKVNVGGADIANLAALGDRYKDRMVQEESRRRAFQENAVSLALQQKLATLSVKNLEAELQRMLLAGGNTPDATTKWIADLHQAAGDDDSFWRMVLAVNVARINPDYAAQLVPPEHLEGPSRVPPS